jgi:fimbrial chaperone protein
LILFRYLFLFLYCVSYPIWGAAIQVAPIRLFFHPNHQIETLKITNQGNAPVVIQLDIKSWQQDEKGDDIHAHTTDLFVMPALFTVQAGQTQIVRVAILKKEKQPSLTEKAYRLMLREVPSSTPEDAQATQLSMAIQMLLPVFVGNQTSSPIQYTGTIGKKTNAHTAVKINNTGSQHFLVTGITIFNTDNQVIFEKNALFSYVLPGISKTISLDTDINIPQNAKIVLKTNS